MQSKHLAPVGLNIMFLSRRFRSSFRPRVLALACLNVYVSVVVLSVMIAHVLLVLQPGSDLGRRMIAPVANGLEFLDSHWKSILILVAPFLSPVVRDLIPRLRKVGS